jgi:hypothetical protein
LISVTLPFKSLHIHLHTVDQHVKKEKREIYKLGKNIARSGFDPLTLGLWALCASSAPSRLIEMKNLLNKKLICDFPRKINQNN